MKLLAGLLLAATICVPVSAEDRRIEFPAGHRVTTEGVAIHDEAIAFMAVPPRPEGDDDAPLGTKVLQLRDGKTVVTEFESKCVPLAFSPDGRYLLARQFDPDVRRCEGCPLAAVLIDSEGRVLWRTEYSPSRVYGFSTSGEAIYGGGRCGFEACYGESIDIYSLNGALLRTVEPGRFSTVVVIGDGSELLVVDELGVRRLVDGAEMRTAWSHQMPARSDLGKQPLRIPPDRMVVWTGKGRFKVVDLQGVVIYEYDACELAKADPERACRDYSIVGLRPGPDGTLWLNHRSREFLIDPDTGTMSEFEVDRRIPGDFEMHNRNVRPSLRGRHFVYAGTRELLIRPIWSDTDD